MYWTRGGWTETGACILSFGFHCCVVSPTFFPFLSSSSIAFPDDTAGKGRGTTADEKEEEEEEEEKDRKKSLQPTPTHTSAKAATKTRVASPLKNGEEEKR